MVKILMNNDSLTKSELYDIITKKIIEMRFDPYSTDYRINSYDIACRVCENLLIKDIDFEGMKLCGILYKGENSTSIALNSRRSSKGQNFDLMHEVIHYLLHEGNYFYCNSMAQDYFEWQANEGAAQFLMPYQSFIPRLVNTINKVYDQTGCLNDSIVTRRLSDHYFVGEQAIKNRVKSLRTEITQYCDTNSISELTIQSLTKQGLNKKYCK